MSSEAGRLPRKRLCAVFAALTAVAGACHAVEDIEWRHRAAHGAVTLNANPLTTAQRTAFYLARGFSGAVIQPYAQACGFSLGMRNSGPMPVRTALADWQAVGADGRRVRLSLPAEWDGQWAKAQVPEPARVAFRWAQFQAENSFEAGDWIMGMATLESPLPGSFRLVARYHDEKGHHDIVLDPLSCAHD